MTWNNLSKNKCPTCNAELQFDGDPFFVLCTITCGFQISHKRFKEIVSLQNANRLLKQSHIDNFQALQDLGSEPIKDQEDSDFINNLI